MATKKVPPDGGYGWVIVLANALGNILFIPMMQSFGLIFKDTFTAMGLSATEQSLIINLNAAFGMMMGLVNGVLLKVFGYRKIAVTAATLTTVGIMLTAYSGTFAQFMISYGIVTSLGFGMNMSAYNLAVNCYFRKKKSKAVGYAMTLTGLGPILMPQLINVLMQIHTVQGTTLILAGVVANSYVAASLLQPVKWHLIDEVIEEETAPIAENPPETKIEVQRSISAIESRRKRSLANSIESLDDIENAPIYGMDSALVGSVMSLHSMKRKASIAASVGSRTNTNINENRDSIYNPEMTQPVKKKPFWRSFLKRVVKFFDLDLLKDPIYVNILIGMSVAIFAEINFSLLTAYILAEFGLTTNQIATFLSVLGITDLIFRFLAPYVGNMLKLPARTMYMMTLILLMLSRYSLLISTNYVFLLGVALGLGVAKGFRTVYMTLVIPMYVPIEKLASAAGLQMMINGFCILVGGPVIGVIRDVTGNYNICIIVLNFVTFTTVVMWSVEMVVLKMRRNDNKIKASEQTNTLLNKS